MATQFVLPRQVKINVAGRPYPGATAQFFQSLTDTPQTVYQDSALTTAHPDIIPSDDDGYFPVIWLDQNAPADYRVLILSATGATLDDQSGLQRKPVTFTSDELAQTLNSLQIRVAEQNTGAIPVNLAYTASPIDVLRYGIVPNDISKAGPNTTLLRTLLDPTKTGPTGLLIFPPFIGNDTYYFNGPIPIRDGIDINLMGCTLDYTATATTADANSGLLFFLRDFSVTNGTINCKVDTTAAAGSGCAIQIGARGTDSSYFTIYDSQLAKPLGNGRLTNLRMNINNTGTHLSSTGGVGILGGVRNLFTDNLKIDGNSTAFLGISYEFGWATSPAGASAQTSHAHNMHFHRTQISNLDAAGGIGLVLAGAYACTVDGLKVKSAAGIFSGTPGESLFYRPWSGEDDVGAKRPNFLRNLVGTNITGTGSAITLIGAQSAVGGYLSSVIAGLGHPADYQAQTDLAEYVLDGFSIGGASTIWGVFTSAMRSPIRNGTIKGLQRGIVLTDEHTFVDIDNTTITGCAQDGINMGVGGSIWSPARARTGSIRNCFVAGNSVSSAGAFAGISVTNCVALLIESCRLNYETAHDGVDETTQGDAILVNTSALGVVCRSNRVGAVPGGSFAYHSLSTTPQGNSIEQPHGTATNAGSWNIDGMGMATSTQIGTATNGINTYAKYVGRRVYDTSNKRIMVAQGSNATDQWEVADGSAAVTPA